MLLFVAQNSMGAEWYYVDEDGIRVRVRVIPNASKNEVVGLLSGRLKVKVQKPAVDGGANDGLIDLLSNTFGLSKSSVVIEHGQRTREKVVLLKGLGEGSFSTSLPFFNL